MEREAAQFNLTATNEGWDFDVALERHVRLFNSLSKYPPSSKMYIVKSRKATPLIAAFKQNLYAVRTHNVHNGKEAMENERE